MIKKVDVLIWAVISLVILQVNLTVHAENTSFSVTANLPENQMDQQKTFFDLKVKAGTKQTLSLSIANLSNRQQTFIVEANSAYTNGNGMISYNQKNKPKTVAAPIFFSDIAKVREPEIRLEANEVKEMLVDLNIPKEGFRGLILGGIYIYQPQPKASEMANGLRTTQSIIKGVRLTNQPETLKPSVGLHSFENHPATKSDFTIWVENEQPIIMDQVNVSGQILQRGKQALILSEGTMEDIKLAPYARFPFKIPLTSTLKPGDYLLKLMVNSHGKQWAFDESFVIEGDVPEVKQTILQPKKDKTSRFILLLSVGVLVSMIVLFLVLRDKKKVKY